MPEAAKAGEKDIDLALSLGQHLTKPFGRKSITTHARQIMSGWKEAVKK